MSIRIPAVTILDRNNSTEVGSGPASIAGGVAYAFNLPQDTDNVVVKLQASVLGGGVSATFQTSDDGGTTWYDVARTSIVSNANATTAQWLSIPTISAGMATAVNQTSSLLTAATGSAAASTLGSQQVSGLPILGVQNRVFMRYTSAVTSVINERIQVRANSQSATA